MNDNIQEGLMASAPGGNSIPSEFGKREIRKAFKHVRRSPCGYLQGPDGVRARDIESQDLDQFLLAVRRDLNSPDYHPMPPRIHPGRDKRGKKRDYAVLNLIDRIGDAACAERLNLIDDLLSPVCCCRSGKGTKYVTEWIWDHLTENPFAWVIVFDLMKAFPNLRPKLIRETIGRLPIGDRAQSFLANLCSEGLLTGYFSSSQVFNHCLTDLDQELLSLSPIPYLRYIDNFLFFAENEQEARALLEKVIDAINQFGFQVHEQAVIECATGFDFLGLTFRMQNGIVTVGPDQKAMARKKTEGWRRYYRSIQNIVKKKRRECTSDKAQAQHHCKEALNTRKQPKQYLSLQVYAYPDSGIALSDSWDSRGGAPTVLPDGVSEIQEAAALCREYCLRVDPKIPDSLDDWRCWLCVDAGCDHEKAFQKMRWFMVLHSYQMSRNTDWLPSRRVRSSIGGTFFPDFDALFGALDKLREGKCSIREIRRMLEQGNNYRPETDQHRIWYESKHWAEVMSSMSKLFKGDPDTQLTSSEKGDVAI